MMSKRALFILLPLFVSISSAVALYFYVKPKIQSWLLSEVQYISDQKLPVQLKIEKIDWTLLFPSIQIYGVNVSSKPNTDANSIWNIPTARVEKVEATLDILRLIAGRLMVSSLVITEPKVEIDLDPYLKDSSNKEPLPLKQLFELTNKFPISRFGIESAHILLKSKKLKAFLQLNASDLLIRNRLDKLIIQLDLKDSVLNIEKKILSADKKTENLPVPFRIQGEALMTENILDISSLKVGLFNSTINIKGNLSNLPMIHLKPEGALDYELISQLEPLSHAIQQYLSFPNLKGEIKSSGRLNLDSKSLTSGFKFQGEQLKINQFDIGDIQFQAQIKNDELTIPLTRITNEAGLLDVKNISIAKNTDNNWFLKSELESKMIDLNEMLSRLGLNSVPVEAFIRAKLNCQGPLWPELSVNCAGDSQIDQFEVRSGNNVKDIIVMIDQGKLQGELNIKKTAVDYKTEITMGKDETASKGFSSGEIVYDKGFKIKFDSDRFELSNIKHLAGLKLEGEGAVHGSTTGNSASATFEMLLDTQKVFFENFYLGNVSGMLEYEKGILNFSNLNGKINNSSYQGQVVVDLNQQHIKSQVEIPRFEINELLSTVSRRFVMPVEVTGLGRAKVQVDGPFQLGKLSYQLSAQMSHGSVASELFDQLDINLESNSGEMHIEKLQMSKNQSVLNMNGVSHPDGQIDFKINGNNLPLEESENVSKLGSQITGLLDVETILKGFILNPDVHINGKVYDLSVEEQEFADSQFQLNINQEQIKGSVELFGNQVKSTFQLPLSEKNPFALKIQANQWSYTTLATLIGGGKLLSDYQSSLSGDLDLHAESGGLWKSTGRGTIDNLLLQRGALKLQNPQPMKLAMNHGLISLEQFILQNDESTESKSYIKILGKDFSADDLTVKLDSQLNLRLLQIFLPFLEELGGQARLNVDISQSLKKPEILGTANIENGFIKIKGFPHPFEKTAADVQFSQSKIMINSITGSLAGGSFEGDGDIAIEGPHNLPTQISAHLQNLNLNVPDKVRTSGDAELTFTGNWFPFTLAGSYNVQSGSFEKEFTEEASGINNLKQSSYLPKMILQGAFEPILLDINILLQQPLRIKNSMMDGAVSGQLQVKGPPASPVLIGKLQAEKASKLIFRDKIFDIQSANIQFNNPQEINPELYIAANSRIVDYDINMLIQGTGKNPQVKLSSVPPLADPDIISLIALGMTTQKNAEATSKQQQDNTSTSLNGIAAGVLTQIEPVKKISQSTGVEIQVSSSYDDTKNVSRQKFTLSKKISDKVKASATQIKGTTENTQEYALQYDLTRSVSIIGRLEDRKQGDNTSSLQNQNQQNESILGIDLEYKKEFK